MSNTLLNEAKSGSRVLLVGPPGCGKTARVKAVADELGYKFICTPVHLKERPDLAGAIVPDRKAGVAVELPLKLLSELRTSKERILWLVDDLGKADISVQGALKSLITRYGEGASLPDNVLVWGATNRPEDAAGVRGVDESLRSEFDATYELPVPIWRPGATEPEFPSVAERGTTLLGTWQDEVKAWASWVISRAQEAEETGDEDRASWLALVASFHLQTDGTWLYRWHKSGNPAHKMPDYRTWEAVMRLPKNMRDSSYIAARIGPAAAAAFVGTMWILDEVPSREEVESDPDGARLPNSTAGQYYVAAMMSIWASTGQGKERPSNIRQMVVYMTRLRRPFAAFAARNIAKRYGASLSVNRHWQKWYEENSDIFSYQ